MISKYPQLLNHGACNSLQTSVWLELLSLKVKAMQKQVAKQRPRASGLLGLQGKKNGATRGSTSCS